MEHLPPVCLLGRRTISPPAARILCGAKNECTLDNAGGLKAQVDEGGRESRRREIQAANDWRIVSAPGARDEERDGGVGIGHCCSGAQMSGSARTGCGGVGTG